MDRQTPAADHRLAPELLTPESRALASDGQPFRGRADVFAALTPTLVACLVTVALLALAGQYRDLVPRFGDNGAYADMADALRAWDFCGIYRFVFFGLSYAVAGAGLLTGIPSIALVPLLSFAAALTAVALAHRLWGATVAAAFSVLSWEWIQRATLGGAEPLFLALVLGAFLAARRARWLPAALLAALAVIVRPHGFFALVAIGVVLAAERRWRTLAACVGVALIVAGLYVLPLWIGFGDPLVNVRWYGSRDYSGSPIGFPLAAIARAALDAREPALTLAKNLAWLALVLLGVVAALAQPRFRQYARRHPVEAIFAASYAAFLLTYSAPHWALNALPRFAIPLLPFVVLALERWLPRDRRVYLAWAVLTACLATASAIGVH